MYTIQNQRINLDQISHVEIGELAVKLNGPGAEITLDESTQETRQLVGHLLYELQWPKANGKILNPDHIVTITKTEEGFVKVNVGGIIIFVPDEDEQDILTRPDTPVAASKLDPSKSDI